ncbi:MAG: hypothetical protein J0L88_02120 [Xanthomonadales bacterium]|nr:hypothetical protein [Xanthomonadales bacterium]
MATRIEWHKVKPATVRTEVLEWVFAVSMLAIGWLGLPTLLLAVMVELVVTVALTHAFHPRRGWRRHLVDVARMVALTAFLSIFILAAYRAAGGFTRGGLPDAREYIGVPLLVLARSLMMRRAARATADPRAHWARGALMRGGALVIGSVFATFACFVAGIPLARLLATLLPERTADLSIGSVFLATTGLMACILSTMSEQEFAAIARQPYLD